MDLNFEIFMVVLLIMSILVVGRFLQDGSSNYLEGTLLVVSTLANLDLSPHFHLLLSLTATVIHGRVSTDGT
jgi:hypothetical protein